MFSLVELVEYLQHVFPESSVSYVIFPAMTASFIDFQIWISHPMVLYNARLSPSSPAADRTAKSADIMR